MNLAVVRQIHSSLVFQVERARHSQLRYLPSSYRSDDSSQESCGDALITQAPGVLLSIRTADCLPILIADPETRAVAAIHAGWRGLLGRIVEKTVSEMRRSFDSEPRHLLAALGPSIRSCCYEVGSDVVDAFCGAFVDSDRFFRKWPGPQEQPPRVPASPSLAPPHRAHHSGSGLCLDLSAAALDQLQGAGVPKAHVETCDLCTSCRNDLFFSYRKEGNRAGRMMAVIGIKRR